MWCEVEKFRCQAFARVLHNPKSKRILITSNLIDLYCELHYQRKEERTMPDVQYLDIAKDIIQSEVERMKTHGLHSKVFRRLLLSSVEIEINEDRYSKAEHLIKELLAIYEKLTQPDIVDRLEHVRALIALSRLKLGPYHLLIRTGNQVKIGKDRLRAQYLPKDAACSYVKVAVDDHLAGNAFACRWKYNN